MFRKFIVVHEDLVELLRHLRETSENFSESWQKYCIRLDIQTLCSLFDVSFDKGFQSPGQCPRVGSIRWET